MAKMRKIEPKTDEFDGPSIGSKKEEKKKIYPHITFRHEFFPETKKWKVGETYEVKLILKMDELSVSRFQNDSGFEIHGFQDLGDKKEPAVPEV